MKKSVHAGVFFVIGLSLLLCGCIGKTKADIPAQIPPLTDDKARIVLTRERQVAGAASTVVFIDIGENIDPNAIIILEDLKIRDILQKKNIASVVGVPVTFLRFNPEMVKSLYSANREPLQGAFFVGSGVEGNYKFNAQVIGSARVGDTLIWDRKSGIMRLGSIWHDGVGFYPENINVQAGKTYYLHYTTRLGQRWELKKVE